MTAPCKGCKDRQLGCHSNCERYIQSKIEHEKRKKLLKDSYELCADIVKRTK